MFCWNNSQRGFTISEAYKLMLTEVGRALPFRIDDVSEFRVVQSNAVPHVINVVFSFYILYKKLIITNRGFGRNMEDMEAMMLPNAIRQLRVFSGKKKFSRSFYTSYTNQL